MFLLTHVCILCGVPGSDACSFGPWKTCVSFQVTGAMKRDDALYGSLFLNAAWHSKGGCIRIDADCEPFFEELNGRTVLRALRCLQDIVAAWREAGCASESHFRAQLAFHLFFSWDSECSEGQEPQDVFWHYIGSRAEALDMPVQQPAHLVLARLACLTRLLFALTGPCRHLSPLVAACRRLSPLVAACRGLSPLVACHATCSFGSRGISRFS